LKVEEERELDSGTFDLKPSDSHNFQYGSSRLDIDDGHIFDEKDTSSEAQNDSGIEYNMHVKSPNLAQKPSTLFSSVSSTDCSNDSKISSNAPVKISAFYKRGEELMKKISLDTMNFVLFDFKPIAYEQFMRLFGSSNTVQISAQTHNNAINQETQTDVTQTETIWTQFPINYTINHITGPEFIDCKRGFGRIDPISTNKHSQKYLTDSIEFLNRFDMKQQQQRHRSNELAVKNINHDELSRFLQESLITISNITTQHEFGKHLEKSSLSFSSGCMRIKYPIGSNLGELATTQILASSNLPNFLFSLHDDIVNKLGFIAVWNVCDETQPICVLSSWSHIVCFEIHTNMKGVIVGGLEDG
jgi:hypothetical protein